MTKNPCFVKTVSMDTSKQSSMGSKVLKEKPPVYALGSTGKVADLPAILDSATKMSLTLNS